MKLTSIRIENFRSIKECFINLNSLCALVGENNVGKSSVLRALNTFFNYENEKKFFIDRSHQYSPRRTAKIELSFSDISNTEKYHEYIYRDKLTIRLSCYFESAKRKLQYKTNNYNDLSLDFINSLKEDISFVLIPNNRDNSHLSWENENVLHKLIDGQLKIITSKRDTLSSKVKNVTEYFEKTALSKISSDLEKYYSVNRSFDFVLGYSEDIDYKLLLSKLSLKIKDMDNLFEISDCGSGIQSLTVIALYRYLANMTHKNFILGIEEPETNLHPQLQRELISGIKSKSLSSNEIQVVFTTHSAVISDQLEHQELVLFRKIRDEKRGFKTVTEQIPTDFWTRYNLEEFQYYQFFRYRNSELFFAEYVIVVESKSEAEVLKHILEELKIDINKSGINIINLEGVTNLKYPFYMLKHLKIPYLVIVDKDFFVPYFNERRESSLYNSGFPKYKYIYSEPELIKELIPNAGDQQKLLRLLEENHSKAMDLLQKYDIICFNYSLEVDLISSKTARNEYYKILKIPPNNQNTRTLLVDNKNAIKKIINILKVLQRTPDRNRPNSYKRIKKLLKNRFS